YSFESVQERLEYLAHLDLGEFDEESAWFTSEWVRLYGTSTDGDHCTTADPPVSEPGDSGEISKGSYVLSGQPRAWWGAMKAFATAYQSCEVLYESPLTEEDPSL